MTYHDNGTERCLGYMFPFPDRGVYEATFGKLDVTPEEAAAHNRCLSSAEIDGLDQNCTLGLGGTFYTGKANGRLIVRTWLGEEVSRNVRSHGNVITFMRKGMTFRGRLRQEEDCFFF